MRLEKRQTSNFSGISLQFRPKLFQMARTPFLEFTKKFFPATQTGALRGIFLFRKMPRPLPFPLLLSLSRPPPGVPLIQKKSFTLYRTLVAVNPPGISPDQ